MVASKTWFPVVKNQGNGDVTFFNEPQWLMLTQSVPLSMPRVNLNMFSSLI